jgi:peptidoglycan/xylan/chitin deacetylase (PgdA/CDA1 family)
MKLRCLALPAVTLALLGMSACASSPDPGDDDSATRPDAMPFLGADAGCADTPAWTGTDHVKASHDPPGGLTAAQVPQFVSIGWDDNFQADAINWATNLLHERVNPAGSGQACTYDGTQVHGTFYLTSVYITDAGATEDATIVKAAWRKELTDGNEIGDHTHNHLDGAEMMFTVDQWKKEIQDCIDWLVKPFDPDEVAKGVVDPSKGIGASKEAIVGFRTPFLAYTDATFTALHDMGFWYDCTIEDGYEDGMDGTNYYWPYTLDEGSPADAKVKPHAGLWELPVYPVIVPPDAKCADYGVPTGLRTKMLNNNPDFDVTTGMITGLDYNMWILYKMSKAEFVATLEYTLDLHLAGNRTPMMFGAHPDLYSATPTDEPVPNATYQERRKAIEEFLDYALAKQAVRVVPNRTILDWLRQPTPLK